MRILAINPGSTSTKIAVFEENKEIFTKNLKHTVEELAPYKKIIDQYDFRRDVIVKELEAAKIPLSSITAVVGRGGLVKPIPGGVYRVSDALIADLKAERMGEHASNLGGLIAREMARKIGPKVDSFIVDPVVVDEMEDIARISGIPELPRVSIFHALNQKAVARRYAREQGKRYEELNLVVVHMGGGISVGCHKKGRVVDVNNALDGDGPFSPERSGGVPVGQMVKLCFSGKYTIDDIKKKIKGKGGLVAYLGTNDAYEVEQRVQKGDKEAEHVYRAMAYQIAKEVGALSTVLCGKIDAVILTGGVAYDKIFVGWLTERIGFLAPVVVYPGEGEMTALAEAGYYAMKGELPIQDYV
ncbi:MAG TPA: butyrate kinase [bacterium]|nr:butyrate kinase [bacterium]